MGGEDAYFQKANYTPPHRDYMCLRVAEGQLVGRGGRCIDHKWRAGRCTQQARGRNGTLILNLGGARTLRFRAVEDFGTTTSGMSLDVRLDDRSVVVFGAGVNAITEHEVLPGGLGKRLSLVYEFALYQDSFSSILGDLEHFDKKFRAVEGFEQRRLEVDKVKVEVL